MTSFLGIGTMSGSSLDGIDVCLVEFTGDMETDIWGYRILRALTLPYTPEWRNRLTSATNLSGEELIALHVQYGHYMGQVISEFVTDDSLKPDFVACHGHTLFHRPDLGYTFQLGDGETTSSYFHCPYVCNFRCKDVALGGQGAPLVPNGEKYLFCSYDICINLGGIANIGQNGLSGYDVCPCNQVLNTLAHEMDPGTEYDVDGQMASKGTVIQELLDQLDRLPYYQKAPPKSLDNQWGKDNVLTILDTKQYAIPDLLRTYVEHVANRLVDACGAYKKRSGSGKISVLVTGGGAFNKTLMKTFTSKLNGTKIDVKETDKQTIEFKEALIIAFLGLRCILGQENVSKEVTGSRSDSVSGSIHRPLSTKKLPTKFEKCYFEFKRLRERTS